MTSATPLTTALTAPVLPQPAPSRVITPGKSHEVADLLGAISSNYPKAKLAMLQVTAKRIAEFKGLSLEQLPLEELASLGIDFKLDLQSRGYKDTTIRTYVHYANLLLGHATQLGLLRPNLELSAAWAPILAALGKKKAGAATIIDYAISINRNPEDFSLADLRNWVKLMQRRGLTYNYLVNQRSRFSCAMARCGYQHDLCEVFQRRGRYAVSQAQLPATLKAETEALADWKQAKFALGRRRGCRHRAVSAEKLVRFICQVYGYAINVKKEPAIHSLSELITKERMTAFVCWFLNERGRKTAPLRANLGLLAAAVRQYPALSSVDFSWFEELMRSMEEDHMEQEQRNSRKARRAVPYDVLAEIPNRILKIREAGGHDRVQTALLVFYELMLRWWLALPWRQRNIRECRIGGDRPNILKAELITSVAMRKPDWVEEALKRNPHEQFWQMHFTARETKTGNEFYAIVPLELVPLLEVYLNQYRSVLVRGSDPETLFINHRGKGFSDKRLTMLIENLTFRYAGSAVNPHLLRDIFAYQWLNDHPEDYLTLAMILWHRDIKTTLQIYGRNFNESNGVCRVDEWLRRRNSKK